MIAIYSLPKDSLPLYSLPSSEEFVPVLVDYATIPKYGIPYLAIPNYSMPTPITVYLIDGILRLSVRKYGDSTISIVAKDSYISAIDLRRRL